MKRPASPPINAEVNLVPSDQIFNQIISYKGVLSECQRLVWFVSRLIKNPVYKFLDQRKLLYRENEQVKYYIQLWFFWRLLHYY